MLKLNPDYEFLLNQQSTFYSDTRLSIQFSIAYRYTNYTVTIYHISKSKLNEDKEENSDKQHHEVRIYRFWSYDSINNIPIESGYFIKMLRTINFYNPIHKKTTSFSRFRKDGSYPKEETTVANYILHSESLIKMFTFILYDFSSDEFRLTDRFCIENSFRKMQNIIMWIQNFLQQHQ